MFNTKRILIIPQNPRNVYVASTGQALKCCHNMFYSSTSMQLRKAHTCKDGPKVPGCSIWALL